MLVGAIGGGVSSAISRARRIAWAGGWAGGWVVFAVCALIGAVAVLAPDLWIGLFSRDAAVAAVARQYLRIAGVGYPIFGMGMALYFASQGTGNMNLQLFAGAVRTAIVVGVGSVVVYAFNAPLSWLFVCVAVGLIAFGGVVSWALKYGRVWNPEAGSA